MRELKEITSVPLVINVPEESILTMSTTNGNPKRPWRRGGGGGRGNNGQSRKSPGRGRGQTRNNGSKKDDKIYKFVPFTRHTVSTNHTFKDMKEAFIRAISLKLGEYAQDV